MIDFYLLKVKPERLPDAFRTTGSLKRGFVELAFDDVQGEGKKEVYDIRGKVATIRQFNNWAKREFGYLRYSVKVGT